LQHGYYICRRKQELNFTTMKTRNYITLGMLCLFVIASCDDKQEEEPPKAPVAEFEVEKTWYEAGEPVVFNNLSENAVSYYWEFGSSTTSTEENPVFTPDLQTPALGYRFRAKLTVMGEDGQEDSTEQFVIASHRMFRRIVIKEMDETIEQSLPSDSEKNTELIWLMGPAADPFAWFGDHQSLPPLVLPDEYELPLESGLWPASLPMGNTPWMLDLYVRLEDDETPELLDSFRFNPTQQEARQVNKHIHLFELSGEHITLDVEYEYVQESSLP